MLGIYSAFCTGDGEFHKVVVPLSSYTYKFDVKKCFYHGKVERKYFGFCTRDKMGKVH